MDECYTYYWVSRQQRVKRSPRPVVARAASFVFQISDLRYCVNSDDATPYLFRVQRLLAKDDNG